MASKEEIIAKTNAAREARKLARDRETAAIKLQVTIWSFIKKGKLILQNFYCILNKVKLIFLRLLIN